nr:AraC family transcriptional regulator [uncultured Hyphomonas sp.]
MREDLEEYALTPIQYVSNESGSVVLIRSQFLAFEGEIAASHYTKFALNIGRTSHLFRRSGAGEVNAAWRRNSIAVQLANDAAIGRSDRSTMIGLAIDLSALGLAAKAGAIETRAGHIVSDTVAAHQIRSMFMGAEHHACSNAFFEQYALSIMRQLTANRSSSAAKAISPLGIRQLARVQAFIDADLTANLSVRDMAREAGMSETWFAKRFAASTGLAPFAYLTARRMERAKDLLKAGNTVTETALEVGYENASKFAAAFKRYSGQPPSAWKHSSC